MCFITFYKSVLHLPFITFVTNNTEPGNTNTEINIMRLDETVFDGTIVFIVLIQKELTLSNKN